METYKNIVEEIINNTSITREDIFDYEFSPLKDEFDSIFEFYNEALRRNAIYGIKPSLLFFKNDFTINAAAGYNNGYYIINIHMGTIFELIQRFREQDNLIIDCGNDEFIEFEKSLDVPINELMYQNAVHFTFYHEMAHLIQKSGLLENMLFEHSDKESDYSELNHLLELDADQFSSLCIGAHVLQYVKNNFGKELTNEQLEKTLILICSSALFYILSFSTNKLDIYYKENTHPHPVIRISCVVFHIVAYVIQSLNQEGYDLEIDAKDVVNKCIEFSNRISIKKFNNKQIEGYKDILGKEALNITEYLKEFRDLEAQDETLASYKWNVKAEALNNN